jgi:hypothetical protein
VRASMFTMLRLALFTGGLESFRKFLSHSNPPFTRANKAGDTFLWHGKPTARNAHSPK